MWQPPAVGGGGAFGSLVDNWVNEKLGAVNRIYRERNYALFFHEFRSIIKGLFGLNVDGPATEPPFAPGYFHSVMTYAEYDSVFELLFFNGDFFQTLLRVNRMDKRTTFKFPVQLLPASTQRLLEVGDLTSLPEVYQGKVQMENNVPVALQLSALELYFACFAYILVCRVPALPTGQPCTLHLDLLRDYLRFLVPLPGDIPTMEEDFLRLSSNVGPAARQSEFRPYNDDPRLAASFLQIMADFWMNQNIYESRPLFGDVATASRNTVGAARTPLGNQPRDRLPGAAQDRGYIPPTVDIVKACHALVVHMQKYSLEASDMAEHEPAQITGPGSPMRGIMYGGPASPVSPDRLPAGRTRGLVLDMDRIMRAISVSLYRFLRMSFRQWPADPSTRHLVALWLAFVQPWKYEVDFDWADVTDSEVVSPAIDVSEFVTKEWYRSYVDVYFPFYSCVLADALERILAMLRNERHSGAMTYPLRLLAQVLGVYVPSAREDEVQFPEESLVQLLKTLEEKYALSGQPYAGAAVALSTPDALSQFEGVTFTYVRIFNAQQPIAFFGRLAREVDYIARSADTEGQAAHRAHARRPVRAGATPHQPSAMEGYAHTVYGFVKAVTGFGPPAILPYASTYGVPPHLRRISHIPPIPATQNQWPGWKYVTKGCELVAGVAGNAARAAADTLFSNTPPDAAPVSPIQETAAMLQKFLDEIGQHVDLDAPPSRPRTREASPVTRRAPALRSRRVMAPTPEMRYAYIHRTPERPRQQFIRPYENKYVIRALFRICQWLETQIHTDMFPMARYLGNYLSYGVLLVLYFVYLLFTTPISV